VQSNASLLYKVVESIQKLHGPLSATGVLADVTKPDQVKNMINTAVETLHGDLTLMVANAGICQIKDALDLTPEDIKLVFDVNFLGTVNCYTLAAKRMIAQLRMAQESGAVLDDNATTAWKYRIIGASSIVAFRPFAMSIHYSAAKWAVRGFTQGFAMEMAKHKIAVNAYAPGVVATQMWSKIDRDLQSVAGTYPGQASHEGADRALMQRLATPEDVANVVAGFLAGPDASFVNGQTIVIDGGIILT
jgi:NAD(P)-dependent dehydrogenase (short-subunit alcohol dehydrogenase family)